MRILGIDYGSKRVGLAVSDESLTLARELSIMSPREFYEKCHDICHELEVGLIVVGWPLNMSGRETQITEAVKGFSARISRETGLPVKTADERLTSVMASHIAGSDRNIDSLAAQIMLQNFLDKNKNFGPAVL